MTQASEHRVTGAVLGCVWLFAVPGVILGPALFSSVPLTILPGWALPASIATAALGAWHLLAAALARDEDLVWVTGYLQAQDAALVLLPICLFIGSRSICRRLFARGPDPRQRWQARRAARLQR